MIQLLKEVDYKVLKITSDVFVENGYIPIKYTCDGENVSPPLTIDYLPSSAKSLAIIVEDPDAPIDTWVHWLIWNMPVSHYIKENKAHGREGVNDFSKHIYCGPCPLSGIHHYVFKVYALDTLLHLPENSKKIHLMREMSNHIVAYGELTGIYKRN